ncbi:MFS transporter [Actinacidiphila glaucinigra]|uniref:Major Facilitator Superfamily protein n=1 Tax=Actinacidiphila glaucinigra TaxID=235986 RepID=A0A239DXI0_9ACTN|nr:MFS transporter [Actinacidiphila glaucinigra]SNS36678.1 Major Facilitator Superfamily protein [Actinacidiphila glaucinigra]
MPPRTAPRSPRSPRPARPARPRAVLAVVLLGVFAFALLQSLINPVLPRLQEELGTTQTHITWVVTAFLLSASVFTPVLGRLGDRYGKDRMLVVALAALAVGSLLSAAATGIGVMIAGRAVQGVGGSVLPLAFGIVRDELPRERIPGAIGLASALTAVGGGSGVVLAGPLEDALGIRALFWLPMVLTAIAAVAARIVVPPSPSRNDGPVSWASALLMAGWLIALLVPLTQAPVWGWSSGRVLGPLVAAVALAAAWITTERRSAGPLVDMRMLRVPAVWTTNLVSLLLGASVFAVLGFMPAFLQTPPESGYGFGASVTRAGLLLLPMTVAMSVAGPVSVRLTRLVGARTVLTSAAALNALALAGLALRHDRAWQAVVAMVLLGTAFGGAVATMSNIVVAAVHPGQTGVAAGVNANVRTVGGALGAALMGGIVGARAGDGGLPAEAGYTCGFAVLALAGLGAVLAAWLVPREGTAEPAPAEHPIAVRS